MARITPDQWLKAKSLFEAGKSLSEIHKETTIDKAAISRAAKKESWEKGKNQQLILDAARVTEEMSTLSSTALDVVVKEIDERTKHIQFFNNATLKNLSLMTRKLDEGTSVLEHKIAQDAIAKGRETVLGKTPDTAIQVNTDNKPRSITINGRAIEPRRAPKA